MIPSPRRRAGGVAPGLNGKSEFDVLIQVLDSRDPIESDFAHGSYLARITPPIQFLFVKICTLTPFSCGRGQQVRERWGDWIRGATTPSHDLAGSLVESVAMLLPPGTDSSGGERRADAPTFRRVIDHLQGGELPSGPGRLAEAIGISIRTLHNACRYGSGHSPGQLIRINKLPGKQC